MTLLIRGGTVFDGLGSEPVVTDVLVDGSKVVAIGPDLPVDADRVIDAAGCWLTPGFIDVHTHYDVELEASPGLTESVRHGVTTVVIGNCSLSVALCTKEELLKLFCRVESLPRELVSAWLDAAPEWDGLASYRAHLASHPLGPNVATLLGHSEVRIAAMGYERAMTVAKATAAERAEMARIVDEAMSLGFLGLSVDLLPWHRIASGQFIGEAVPSQQAAWSEVAELATVVRRHDRVLQATPNAMSKLSGVFLFWLSMGLVRRSLAVTVVSAMDVVANRAIWRLQVLGAWLVNTLFGGDFRWQVLSVPFQNFADGVNTPIFEEFDQGVKAISAAPEDRRAMFADPEFRAEFRADWESREARMFHRDFGRMEVVASPDVTHVGHAISELAARAGKDALAFFMDSIAAHDAAFRWTTVVGNDRDPERHRILASSGTLPGFNDAGAHNQQMAFQDGALALLRQSLDPDCPLSPTEAVHRLTGETATWLGLDVGRVEVGAVADLVLIDPDVLVDGLGPPIALDDPGFGTLPRMVRRSDGVVRAVAIGGEVVFEDGEFIEGYGARRTGRLLSADRA